MSPPDPAELRRALGRFATGITVITCRTVSGQWVGLTANSFQSLSLSPPLVLWSLRLQSGSLAAFDEASHFAVNVLAEGQVEVSRRFASKEADKFGEGAWALGAHGSPLLAGSVAHFECALRERLVQGDHALYIGEVLASAESSLPPLLYQSGHYHLLGEVL